MFKVAAIVLLLQTEVALELVLVQCICCVLAACCLQCCLVSAKQQSGSFEINLDVVAVTQSLARCALFLLWEFWYIKFVPFVAAAFSCAATDNDVGGNDGGVLFNDDDDKAVADNDEDDDNCNDADNVADNGNGVAANKNCSLTFVGSASSSSSSSSS